MRTLARYTKKNEPPIEVITKNGEYYLLFGGRTIDKFDVGELDANALVRLFVSRKVKQGYENAICGELV